MMCEIVAATLFFDIFLPRRYCRDDSTGHRPRNALIPSSVVKYGDSRFLETLTIEFRLLK
jgi:hypothetical protein